MDSHLLATYTEERVRDVAAPPSVLWEVVAGLGGRQGYHAFDRLWRLRAGLDRVVGGPGMRGRSDGAPHPGDPLDFWRVEHVEPSGSLRLRAEMRMPGTAWLGLEVEPDGSGARLVQQTWFEPHGAVGHAFWWAELPGHKLVFARMCDGIAAEAERRHRHR